MTYKRNRFWLVQETPVEPPKVVAVKPHPSEIMIGAFPSKGRAEAALLAMESGQDAGEIYSRRMKSVKQSNGN